MRIDLRSYDFCFTDYEMFKVDCSDCSDNYCSCFWNNICNNENVRYCVIGRETCPTSGRLHGQGYVYFENERNWSAIQKLLNPRCFKICDGTIQQNENYCTKDKDVIFRFGEKPKQGARKDLKVIKQLVLDGSMTMAEIVFNHCNKLQDITFAEKLMKYRPMSKKHRQMKNLWIYGESGCGKTHYVYEKEPDVFRPVSSKWWDGYDGEEAILIDDFRPDWCSFAHLLQLTDKYPLKAEVKGSTVEAKWTRCYITSPYNIDRTFENNNGENIYQIKRRFEEICLDRLNSDA